MNKELIDQTNQQGPQKCGVTTILFSARAGETGYQKEKSKENNKNPVSHREVR